MKPGEKRIGWLNGGGSGLRSGLKYRKIVGWGILVDELDELVRTIRDVFPKECEFSLALKVFIDNIQSGEKQNRQFGYMRGLVFELVFDLGHFLDQKIDYFLSKRHLRFGFESIRLTKNLYCYKLFHNMQYPTFPFAPSYSEASEMFSSFISKPLIFPRIDSLSC